MIGLRDEDDSDDTREYELASLGEGCGSTGQGENYFKPPLLEKRKRSAIIGNRSCGSIFPHFSAP